MRKQQKDLVKSGQAGRIIVPMLLDNNQSKGRAMQNQLIKAAIRGFNGEADALLVKVSVSNVEKKIQALKKAFQQLNRMYSRNQIEITIPYLNLKIEELRLVLSLSYRSKKKKNYCESKEQKSVRTKNFRLKLKHVESNWKKIELTLKIWFLRLRNF